MQIEMEPKEDLSFKKVEDNSPIVKTVPAVKAEFLENCVRVDLGQGFTKLLEYTDFENAFLEMIGKKKIQSKYNDLILPPNVIHIGHSSSELKVMCYYPEGVRNINFSSNIRPRVFPNIIISHNLTVDKAAWKILSSYFLCTDLSISQLERKFIYKADHNKRIYILPFSNMYDSGLMCTGQNQLPRTIEKGDLRSLNQYYEMIFNSPFNNDLGVKAISSSSQYREPSIWFDYLARRAEDPNPKFPYEEINGYRAQI